MHPLPIKQKPEQQSENSDPQHIGKIIEDISWLDLLRSKEKPLKPTG